jgi:hypothetical protein
LKHADVLRLINMVFQCRSGYASDDLNAAQQLTAESAWARGFLPSMVVLVRKAPAGGRVKICAS